MRNKDRIPISSLLYKEWAVDTPGQMTIPLIRYVSSLLSNIQEADPAPSLHEPSLTAKTSPDWIRAAIYATDWESKETSERHQEREGSLCKNAVKEVRLVG
jgi:hypothetical protein